MASNIGQFTIPSGQVGYLDMLVQDCDQLKFFLDISTTSTVTSVTTVNGYGGPQDSSITWPWNQAIPNSFLVGSHPATSVDWELTTSSCTVSSLVSNRQTSTFQLPKASRNSWKSIIITAGSANAVVTVYAEVV